MQNFIAILVALVLFAIVAALSTLVVAVSMNLIYGLLGLIVIAIVHVGTGGRTWFVTHEQPKQVIGAKILISAIDGLAGNTEILPIAIIREVKDNSYRAYFLKPVQVEAKIEHYVDLYARHRGYPLSGVGKWRGRFVAGILESGRGFIGMIYRTN